MPCRTDWPDDITVSKTVYNRYKKEGDNMARLLCATIRGTIKRAKAANVAVKDFPEYQNLMAIPGMREWWTQHKKEDRARKLKEIEDKKNAAIEAKRRLKIALNEAKRAERELKSITKKTEADPNYIALANSIIKGKK